MRNVYLMIHRQYQAHSDHVILNRAAKPELDIVVRKDDIGM